ncbi:acyl-CoA thioester hydrolase [Arthrobacter sp. GAS37]
MDRMSKTQPRASVERTVEWVDTDASGHQHNSAVMRWVESAEAELFLRTLGLPDYFPSVPRIHQEIHFKAKLWFGQRITATVGISKLGRTSMTYAFEVQGHPHDGLAGSLAAFGTVTVAHVPPGSAKAQPWPAAVVEAVAPAQSSGAEDRSGVNSPPTTQTAGS